MATAILLVFLVVSGAVTSQDSPDIPRDYEYDVGPSEITEEETPDNGKPDIRLPPSIEKGPQPMIVFRTEESLTLDCEGIGTPTPKFSWYRNGALLDENLPNIKRPDPNKGTIVIDPATSLDEGYYQCFAENTYGKAVSDVAFLQRAVVSPYPAGQPVREYEANQGDGLKVECQATKCVPKPTYSWVIAKNEVDESPIPVSLNQRVQIDDDGNLYFAHAQLADHQDNKLYKCIVFNPYLDITTGGSYSRVKIIPQSGTLRKPPFNSFHTPDPAVGLIGGEITFKCLFSGNPAPKVRWDYEEAGRPLPIGRYSSTETTLRIWNIQWEDEGVIVCTGANEEGTDTAKISFDVQATPSYVGESYVKNVNATNNETVKLECVAEGEPSVEVQWHMNGEPLGDPLPSRMRFEQSGRTLVVEEVCKTCRSPARSTDLMVIQCNASNTHGYAYSAGYINVLKSTVMVTPPSNVELEFYKDVVFTCTGESDDSTPVYYEWLYNGKPVEYEPGRVQQDEDGSLRLITKDEEEGGKGFEGEYTCIATNGYSQATAVASLTVPTGPVPVKGASIGDIWWVFLIVALILLLLILLLCCCLCCQRNRGDTYPVDEKERKNGNDPEKELADSGFQDYQRPEDEPVKGSRASLSSTIKLDSDEEGSLAEYGDLDAGKFNEDGSFIGQYSTDKKKRASPGETNV